MIVRGRTVCGMLLLSLALSLATTPAEDATLVLTGGRIVTLDEERPEVRAMAVRGDRILALGSVDEISEYVGDTTRVIRLGGQLVLPGFIEGHAHFLGIGARSLTVDLSKVRDFDEIIELVAEAARGARPGEAVIGTGWHQDKWQRTPEPSVDGLPYHDKLSEKTPDNPVILYHASGHAAFANEKAMQMCGITEDTPDPEGGTIVRDGSGRAIGAFRETAEYLLGAATLRARAVEPDRLAALAQAECLSKGVTSFQDAGSSVEDVMLFRDLVDSDQLHMRLWVMLSSSNDLLARRAADLRLVGHGDHRLTVRAVKRSLDGALGSHGAWLLEPYEDVADTSGLNTYPLADLEQTARLCLEHDLQLCVHAIGDRANREVLDLFERAFDSRESGDHDLRWRIEHAQHLHPTDIPRFAQLGVIASMQGVHCTSDGPWVPSRLGDARTAAGAYVWRDLLDSGALVTGGTDAPVEDVDPIASFYAMVSRRLPDGSVFYPEQRLSRLEALRAYTLSAAEAAFEEEHKGSLSVGKLADIVVLDRDILDCPEDRIPGTQVLLTIVGGEVRYESR